MEAILKAWPYIKIVLLMIFIITTFLLLILLIPLALNNKKLGIYIDQIRKRGEITPISSILLMYDMLLMIHIFDTYPEIKNNAKFNQNKIIIDLQKRIAIQSKIAKPVAIIYFSTVILLIVLANWLGG